MAEPIQVKITDDTGTSTISAGNVSQNNPNKPINQSARENKKASVLTTASHMVLMRSINYTTSNVGKWTGSNRLQNQINTTKQLIGYGVAFAVNPILGAVTVAMDGFTNVIDYAYEDKWNRIKSEQAQARSGGKGGYRR
jgi:hypothetical protein